MAVKTAEGDKITITAGVIVIDKQEHLARRAYVVGRMTEKSSVGRAVGAGKGALIGMLAGPVGAVVGAGLGSMLASGKSTIQVAIETTKGARIVVDVTPEKLAALEMGLGIKLG